MSAPASPPLTPTHEGTWWRNYCNVNGDWSWMTFEVWEWEPGQGLTSRQGPISELHPEIKWGGECVPPTLDPAPNPD